MHKQRVSLALLAAAIGLAPATSALAEGLYFGISGGLATTDLPSKAAFDESELTELADRLANELTVPFSILDAESTMDDNDVAWGVQIGYRWNRYFAAEIGYVNLGDARYEADVVVTEGVETYDLEESVRINSTGPTVSALGIFPISEQFDIHGRAGVYFADTRIRDRTLDVEAKVNVFHENFDASSTDLFFGVGAAWNINESYSLRVEYQRFLDVGDEDKSGEADVDLISLNILFR